MDNAKNDSSASADEHYWNALPKYISAVRAAIVLSGSIDGQRVESHRRYWSSVLFVRLCSVATSVLHLCPGSPLDSTGNHWDFSSLAPLFRSLIQTAQTLFYLGTEAVDDDESEARIVTMQLHDCLERQNFFRNSGAAADEILEFQAQADRLRNALSVNPYILGLPPRQRESVMAGERASILTDDQIADRMGLLDRNGRAFLGLISAHAEVSPLAFYLVGENSRGTGKENEVDKRYIAAAIDLTCDFVIRSEFDVRAQFSDTLSARRWKASVKSENERLRNALDYILQQQGAQVDEFTSADGPEAPLLCSDCFQDEGVRLSARAVGQRDLSECPHCGSHAGVKLSRTPIAKLAQQFFVTGTIRRARFGGAPVVQFNKHQLTSIEVPPWLEPDVRLIERTIGVGFFVYGPRLWTIGEIEPLKGLQDESAQTEVIRRILAAYPVRELNGNECFYRLRKNPKSPGDLDQYDPPPADRLGQGRFDSSELPVLYGSQDLEVCLHECRVAADDESYVATIVPRRNLKLLNLAEPLIEEDTTEFESLDLALHMLFLAGSHSYGICRQIAQAARSQGFDGLVYPSYFTLLRTGTIPFETVYGLSARRFPNVREHVRATTISNLALFGRPLADGSVTVRCINKVTLRKVKYDLVFGPLLA